MPKRLPYEAAIFAALVLGSCQGPALSQRQQEQVSATVIDEAGDSRAVRDLRDRVDRLESRMDALTNS